MQGGTWLGVTKNGRFATITNYRDRSLIKDSTRSRGGIVRAFLEGAMGPVEFCNELMQNLDEYNPFNLLAGDQRQLIYFNSVAGSTRVLKPGVYSLSNAMLDTPWEKVIHGKREFIECISAENVPTDCILSVLSNETKYTANLPETGFGEEMEIKLSSIFITLDDFGTRVSTVVLVDSSGGIQFVERSFKSNQKKYTESNYSLKIRS